MSRLSIALLNKSHDRTGFSCGNEALDKYIKTQARQDAKRNATTVYVLTETSRPRIILGFYTLAAGSVHLREVPKELRKKLPKYPDVPVAVVGRLAVNVQHQNQGYGKILLADALKTSKKVASSIGIVGVVVDAKNAAAGRFYERFGFVQILDNPLKFFYPIYRVPD